MNMQPASSRCREHEILKARYKADLNVYRLAVRQLDLCDSRNFNRVYEDAERARVAFESAHSSLNNHVAEHKCG
jgi:hypothetical protein